MAQTPEQRRRIRELEQEGLVNQPKGREGSVAARRETPDLAALARGRPLSGRPLPIGLAQAPEAPSNAAKRRLLEQLRRQGSVNVPGASPVSRGKAREILHHGTVHGRPISQAQRGLFGVIASGKTPRKAAYR